MLQTKTSHFTLVRSDFWRPFRATGSHQWADSPEQTGTSYASSRGLCCQCATTSSARGAEPPGARSTRCSPCSFRPLSILGMSTLQGCAFSGLRGWHRYQAGDHWEDLRQVPRSKVIKGFEKVSSRKCLQGPEERGCWKLLKVWQDELGHRLTAKCYAATRPAMVFFSS